MILRQWTRWVVVGLVVNGVLYLVYVLLTRTLLTPPIAMTVTYVMGVGLGFLGNRHWSFEHSGPASSALVRYLIAYALGYLVNLVGLRVGVEVLALRHEVAQAGMVFIIACLMFLMQKYYVFAGSTALPPEPSERCS